MQEFKVQGFDQRSAFDGTERPLRGVRFPKKLGGLLELAWQTKYEKGAQPKIQITFDNKTQLTTVSSYQDLERIVKSLFPRREAVSSVVFSFATDPPIFVHELAGGGNLFTCALRSQQLPERSMIVQITVPNNRIDSFNETLYGQEKKKSFAKPAAPLALDVTDIHSEPERAKVSVAPEFERTQMSPNLIQVQDEEPILKKEELSSDISIYDSKTFLSQDPEKQQMNNWQANASAYLKERRGYLSRYVPLAEADKSEEIKRLFNLSSWLVIYPDEATLPSEIKISNKWRSLTLSLDQVPFFTHLNDNEEFFVRQDELQQDVLYLQRMKKIKESKTFYRRVAQLMSRWLTSEGLQEGYKMVEVGAPIKIKFFDDQGIRFFHQQQKNR